MSVEKLWAGMRTVTVVVGIVLTSSAATLAQTRESSPFAGPKANTGRVTHKMEKGRHVLALSADFVVPDTPDPHWQVVDAKGTVYLLDRLVVKGDRQVRELVVPAYVKDVAKVVIWCAWAEANLGEASFGRPVNTE